MGAGRPPLRIGQHGNIRRVQIEQGVWLAKCRYRDSDGVTRIVERRSPGPDQRGKRAEDALIEALAARKPPGAGHINADTKITVLIDWHIERLEEDARAVRTIDTYRYTAGKLGKIISGVRVTEATPPRIDAALRSMRTAHGAGMAKQAKTLLRGGLQLAVMAGALQSNPVRDVTGEIKPKTRRKGAVGINGQQLRDLLVKVRASQFCRAHDLVDPVTLLIATGLRRSELLGLRWSDYDRAASSVTVTGKLVRASGKGLVRVDEAKTAAGERTLPLPPFAVDMLTNRRKVEYYGEQTMIFPSTAGTWRDPDNFNAAWREARDALGVPDVTSHSFRKSIATLIDEGGLSARVGADHLGHAKVSMTQDIYMTRGRTHPAVAVLVQHAVIADE